MVQLFGNTPLRWSCSVLHVGPFREEFTICLFVCFKALLLVWRRAAVCHEKVPTHDETQHTVGERKETEQERERERESKSHHPSPPPPSFPSFLPSSSFLLYASHSLLTHRLAQVHGATPGEPPHLAEVVVGPQVGERGASLAVAGQVLGLGLGRQGPHLAAAAPVQGVLLRVGHSEGGGTQLRQGLARLPGSPLQRPHGAPLPVLEQYPNAPLEAAREGGREKEREREKRSEYIYCIYAKHRSRGLWSEGKRGGGERWSQRRSEDCISTG